MKILINENLTPWAQHSNDRIGSLDLRSNSIWEQVGFVGVYSASTYMTHKEIALEFGLSSARIRQIEEKALKKLQHPKRSKILKEFLFD